MTYILKHRALARRWEGERASLKMKGHGAVAGPSYALKVKTLKLSGGTFK